MHTCGHLLDVGLGCVIVMNPTQVARVDVGAEVEGLAVEGAVIGAELGALADCQHVLIDDGRG